MSAIFVGIDPGLTGAVAAVDAGGEIVGVWDAPTVAVLKSERRRQDPDVAAMDRILRELQADHDIQRVTLEKPQPMSKGGKRGKKRKYGDRGAPPAGMKQGKEGEGWGAIANFSLGNGYGLWWGIVVARGLPLDRVPGATWRAKMLPGREKGKEANRLAAVERWPSWAAELKLKKHHGRADALWLAEYGRRR